MLAFFLNLRSKSFLRSSSGTSYPYPRTHTTLMVVPSTRPIGPEEPRAPKKQSSGRRPPLNRSIPPIPESKSNESIMSHSSRRSIDKADESQPSDCVVIENRNVVQQLQRNPPKSSTGIPRPSTTKRLSDSKSGHKSGKGSETPRSPLMTVARTVKNKFTKLTRMGRHEQHDVSMKGSQSFSGIRQPKASIPKRVDQNANRVIKSSSMEVPSTSQDTTASTSRHMVVIPQNPTRLEDFSEEASLAEQVELKENEDPVKREEITVARVSEVRRTVQPQQAVSMTLSADVLVVTKEFDASDSTVTQRSETKHVELEEKAMNETDPAYDSQQTTAATDSERQPLDSSQSPLLEQSPEELPQSRLVLKTPQLPRKQHTFELGQKIPDTSSELKAAEKVVPKTVVEEQAPQVPMEEGSPPARYVMTVKTPEAMRKHLAFVVDESESQATATPVPSSPKKRKKIIKQRSMPETVRASVSPERYIMTVKTPEPLRRHHTFTIKERSKSPDVPYIEEGEITEPIATVGPSAEKRRRTRSEDAKRTKKTEEMSKIEKFTMSVRTPFMMRKFKTFMVEEKPKAEEIPTSKSDEPLLHAKVSFADDVQEHTAAKAEVAPAPEPMPTPHLRRKHKVSREEPNEVKDELETHNEMFVLSTSTPLTMRKFQTFMIEDKKQVVEQPVKSLTEGNLEAIASLEREPELSEKTPLKTSDMYSLTTMTPLPLRKKLPDESHLERIARDKSRSTSKSPEKMSLFIMGRSYNYVAEKEHKEPEKEKEKEVVKCAVVTPQRVDVEYETPRRECSQSDNAEPIERKNSCSSGVTTPEEEIPMDTHLTPTEEVKDEVLITRPIRRPPEVTSPIAEEPEVSGSFEPHQSQVTVEKTFKETFRSSKKEMKQPVFRPPSPPKEMYKPITLSKSTSPLKTKESIEKTEMSTSHSEGRTKPLLSIRSKSEDRREKKAEEKERERAAKKGKRDDRDKERLPKSPKMPITARSLRSAGKMLAPSFFRKGESKIPKSSKTATSPQTVTATKTRMSLPFRNGRRAPLAEFESLVVEDSPAVENHPLTFEKWSNSPRGKRRHSAHVNGFSEPIVEEGDGNGNVSTFAASKVECTMSPALPRHETDRGLIDDEILDQPMLVGDTFSHSESMDCLSAVRRMEFEAEKATLISIDRSLIEDNDAVPQTLGIANLTMVDCLLSAFIRTLRPRRTYDNGGMQSTTTRAAAVFTAPPSAYRKTLEDGLNEVEDIRSQLEKLQYLVSQEMRGPGPGVDDRDALLRENEALRKQLHEKDELILSLRQQIAAQHS
ncbi:unnamed protein product [Cylicocyclus nassatus]|uniref:Uncharacterized protein n=1 Tax=Cylicocyclus nassatus TaxID=53992 RepID=A0AA36H1W4_CYLNA|nr:unnamed protein product [Cylicocyclus nassatus]